MNPRAVVWLLTWHKFATLAKKASVNKQHKTAKLYASHARVCLGQIDRWSFE